VCVCVCPHGTNLPRALFLWSYIVGYFFQSVNNIQDSLILILIYLFTATGLTPGGSSTLHIYKKQYTEQHEHNTLNIAYRTITTYITSGNNRNYVRRPTFIYDNISLSSSKNEKFFRKKLEEFKSHIYFHNFSRKSCLVWNNEEKYVRTIQDTNNNVIRYMHIASWINSITNSHSE
jgi:hypothetical protein